MDTNRKAISNSEQEMSRIRANMQKFLDDIAPLKNVGLQVKGIALKLGKMEERMRNSTTETDLVNWREETRVAKIRTNEAIAGI